jgi:hypothetical protein
MLFVEEFTVDTANLGKMMDYIEEALKVIKDLEAPYLKSVKVYHSNEAPELFHVCYDIEKRENVAAMSKEFKNHPVGMTLLPRFYSLIVENSHHERYFDLVNSIGRHRFSSLPSKNIPIYQIN